MTAIAVGQRLRSQVCSTEVIVLRAGTPAAVLRCGGLPLTTDAPTGGLLPAIVPDAAGGNPIGKRFADEETGTEVLVTRAGTGALCVDGRPLELRQPKNLPSSD